MIDYVLMDSTVRYCAVDGHIARDIDAWIFFAQPVFLIVDPWWEWTSELKNLIIDNETFDSQRSQPYTNQI